MKVAIHRKRMLHTRPPAPFSQWGPQAAVRYAALQGFDFSRPYHCGWNTLATEFVFEHASMGEKQLTPHITTRLDSIEIERKLAAEAKREKEKENAVKVFIP